MVTRTLPASTHTYSYGEDGQLSGESITGGKLDGAVFATTYDTLGRRSGYAWNYQGATQATGYGYEAASGRLGSVSAFGKTVTYGRDMVTGRPTTVSHGSGTGLHGTYVYDGESRLESLTWRQGEAGTIMNQHTYSHDSAGRRSGVTRENGEAWSYTYNNRGEVTAGAKANSNGVKPGHTYGYAYDGIGNRTLNTEDAPEGILTLEWNYNALNQLNDRETAWSWWIQGMADPAAQVRVNGELATREANGEFSYGMYSDAAPLEYWEDVGIHTKLPGGGSNGSDLVVTREGHVLYPGPAEEYRYDLDGNLIKDARWRYEWDGENRLIRMSMADVAGSAGMPEQVIEFSYDAQGRRISKRVQGRVGGVLKEIRDWRYLYDGWNLVSEHDVCVGYRGIGWRQRHYAWGLDLSGTEQGAGGGEVC